MVSIRMSLTYWPFSIAKHSTGCKTLVSLRFTTFTTNSIIYKAKKKTSWQHMALLEKSLVLVIQAEQYICEHDLDVTVYQ